MAIFRKKWVFLGLCCFTYMCAYLCRVNLSSALGRMEVALEVSSATLGALGTAYFFFYACAQLVSGFFGDRVRPERLMFLGAVGVAATNVSISLSHAFPVILVLWCMNGIFQSMFWGPMSRLLAGRFEKGERVLVSTCCSLSMPLAFILSWSVLTPMLAEGPWEMNFRVPGVIIMIPMVLWLTIVVSGTKDKNAVPVSQEKASMKEFMKTMNKDRLWMAATASMCDGMLKESFTIWAPLILARMLGVASVKESALYLILFPLANAAMIALNARIIKKMGISLRTSMIVLFVLVAVCAVVLMSGVDSVILTVVLMALISGFGYAANNVLLGQLPMAYADKNMTSSLVGVLDFSAYVGAGVASFGLGLLISGSDLRAIALVWLAASALAVVVTIFARGQVSASVRRQQG